MTDDDAIKIAGDVLVEVWRPSSRHRVSVEEKDRERRWVDVLEASVLHPGKWTAVTLTIYDRVIDGNNLPGDDESGDPS